MEKNYFYLGTSDDNKLIKFIRIAFGIICIAVAVFWVIFNLSYIKNNETTWVTILFLSGFGIYQVWAGLGYAKTFIEIGSEAIKLKKNAIIPAETINSEQIEKIELFPLNVVLHLKNGRKSRLRFGTTYPDLIDDVKDAIIIFSENNNLVLEFIEEEI